MINIRKKHNCCGCSACKQLCPQHCIILKEDNEGFLYPQVDKQRCTSCGICEKVCPVLNQTAAYPPLKVCAAKNKDAQELLLSSSGGLFVVFAKKTIKDGGVVFGARFDESWNVIHSYTETEEGICAFIGSKYVQSRIGNTYSEARTFLRSGRKVLFTGTSCQIAGLKTFLGHEYDNLLTIDVICHGAPSPLVWKRYISDITKDVINGRVKRISFRDKRHGWKNFSFVLTYSYSLSNGNPETTSLSHTFEKDPYMQLFLSNMTLRPSCYHCPSKGGKSKSDLTIADFWGIEGVRADFDDDKGVGLLIVNTEKGQCATDKESLSLIEVSLSEATGCNPSYYHSVSKPWERRLCFWLISRTKRSIYDVAQLIWYLSYIDSIKNNIKLKIRRLLAK